MTDSILRSYSAFSQTTTVPFAQPIPPTPILDTYPGATGAWSLRKLKTGATLAARIRRDSDNTEQDIGFTFIGDFDAAAAATFIGGGSGFFTKLYDQSGNAWDLIQATAGNQPGYLATGLSSKPTADFVAGASPRQMAATGSVLSNFITNTTGYAIIVMYKDSSFTNDGNVFIDDAQGFFWLRTKSTPAMEASNFDGNQDVATVTTGVVINTSMIVEWAHLSGNLICNVNNGTDATTVSGNTSNLTFGPLNVGSSDLSTGGRMRMSELIFYNTDPGRTSVRAAVNTYYGAY